MIGADRDDAVFMGLSRWNLLNRDDIAPMTLIGVETLSEAAAFAAPRHGDHVGQEHGEGLVADDLARAPDGVAKPQRRLLAGEAGRAGRRQFRGERLIFPELAPLFERVVELIGQVEMVLDDAFVAAGDEDEMLDPGFARLLDDMLEHRPIDDGEHFLGHGLGRRQESGSKAGDRKNRFANRLAHSDSSPNRRRPRLLIENAPLTISSYPRSQSLDQSASKWRPDDQASYGLRS